MLLQPSRRRCVQNLQCSQQLHKTLPCRPSRYSARTSSFPDPVTVLVCNLQERQAHEATKAALARADLHAQHARQRATENQRRLTEQTQLAEGHVARLDALGREADGLRQQLQQQRERCGALEAELGTLADGFAAQAPSVAALEALLLGQEVPNGDAVVRQQNALLLERVRLLEEQASRAESLAAALAEAQDQLAGAQAGQADAAARAKEAAEQVADLQQELQAVRDEQALQRAADVADKMQAAVEVATSNVRDKLQVCIFLSFGQYRC